LVDDIRSKLNRDYVNIQYYDNDHIYINTESNKQLISTTTLIGLFEPKFEKEYWLGVKAKEYGITEEELEHIWDHTKLHGLSRGSYLHNYIENALQRKFDSTIICNEKAQALKFIHDFYASDYVHVVSELVVGNEILGGMIDNLSLKDGKFHVIDYKTDKKFFRNSSYKYLPPIDHLDKCEYTKYSLQTSIYRMLLEEKGYHVEKQLVIWFKQNCDYKVIECEYLKEECQQLLTTYQHSEFR